MRETKEWNQHEWVNALPRDAAVSSLTFSRCGRREWKRQMDEPQSGLPFHSEPVSISILSIPAFTTVNKNVSATQLVELSYNSLDR